MNAIEHETEHEQHETTPGTTPTWGAFRFGDGTRYGAAAPAQPEPEPTDGDR